MSLCLPAGFLCAGHRGYIQEAQAPRPAAKFRGSGSQGLEVQVMAGGCAAGASRTAASDARIFDSGRIELGRQPDVVCAADTAVH